MLLYYNRSFRRVVFSRFGSILWRPDNVAFGLTLSLASLIMEMMETDQSEYAPDLPHHYAILAIGTVVAFAVVFRTNLGWQRYWESVTQLHFMYSKWSDTFTQIAAFVNVSIMQSQEQLGSGSDPKLKAKIHRLKTELQNLEANFALASALAASRLSHGDCERMAKRVEERRVPWRDQILLRRELRLIQDDSLATLPEFVPWDEYRGQRYSDLKELGNAHRQSVGVRNETKYNARFLVKSAPREAEAKALTAATDRVGMAMYWVVHGLARLSRDIDIAAPIQSRMYQELSNGMLGFSNAIKIADVPFPFPYAQLLSFILLVFSLFIPVYMVSFTKSIYVSPVLTFVFFAGIWGINQVAIELENPFGPDANDISLQDFHDRFITTLREVADAHNCALEVCAEKEAAIRELFFAAVPADPTKAAKVNNEHLTPEAQALDKSAAYVAGAGAALVDRGTLGTTPGLPLDRSLPDAAHAAAKLLQAADYHFASVPMLEAALQQAAAGRLHEPVGGFGLAPGSIPHIATPIPGADYRFGGHERIDSARLAQQPGQLGLHRDTGWDARGAAGGGASGPSIQQAQRLVPDHRNAAPDRGPVSEATSGGTQARGQAGWPPGPTGAKRQGNAHSFAAPLAL